MFFNVRFDGCLTDLQLADKKLASIEHFDKLSVTEHAIFLKACQLTTYRLTTYRLTTYQLTDLQLTDLRLKKTYPFGGIKLSFTDLPFLVWTITPTSPNL